MTVLVVDDEPNDVEAVRNPLEKAGFLVFSAASVDSALQIFRHNARGFDMAVLDISLPEKNGVDLYQDLLALNPNLKVLFVSGHVGAEIIRFYGLRATDRHFLQKPFEAAVLVARVREVIGIAGTVAAGGLSGAAAGNTQREQRVSVVARLGWSRL